ncbi:MAG TPA: hypothetical protein VHJ78_00795 [Actinomycetota bacterium]|nr:hypothetical protein [Actinomycetota bacterium]
MTARRRTRISAVCLLLLLVPTACSSGGGEAGEGPQPVGEILELKGDVVSIGDEAVEQTGQKLFRGSVLSSDAEGGAIFEIDGRIRSCDFDEGVRLEIMPSSGVLVHVAEGETLCMTPPGKPSAEPVRFTAGDKEEVTVSFLDPIFSVASAADRVTTWVKFGFTEVSKDGGKGVLLGPDSQITVQGDHEVSRPSPFEDEGLQVSARQALNRMTSELPEPDYSMPPAQGSDAVQRIAASRQLRVGIDGTRSRPTEAFVTSFTGFLAERWGLALRTSFLQPQAAAAALSEGELDVFISPGSVTNGRFLPLFGAEDETEWVMWVAEDQPLEDALGKFLLNALNYGDYGRLYLAAFGRVPTYEAVRQLVYPTAGGEEGTAGRWQQESERPRPLPIGSRAGRPADATPTPAAPDGRPADSEVRVTDVTLSAEPARFVGNCPVTIQFRGRIVAEGGRGDVQYRYRDEAGETTGIQKLTFDGPGAKELSFSRSIASDGEGAQTLEVLAPTSATSNTAGYDVTCETTPPPSDPIAELLGSVQDTVSDVAASLSEVLSNLLGR